MKPSVIVKDYLEGIRLTVDSDGLLIEVTDYHTAPLRLSFAQLGEFGLAPSDANPQAEDSSEPG